MTAISRTFTWSRPNPTPVENIFHLWVYKSRWKYQTDGCHKKDDRGNVVHNAAVKEARGQWFRLGFLQERNLEMEAGRGFRTEVKVWFKKCALGKRITFSSWMAGENCGGVVRTESMSEVKAVIKRSWWWRQTWRWGLGKWPKVYWIHPVSVRRPLRFRKVVTGFGLEFYRCS